jgi:hypothetical protein
VSEPSLFLGLSESELRSKEGSHKEIRRTQSLDPVLSTREVLDLASRALLEKEKSKKRIASRYSPLASAKQDSSFFDTQSSSSSSSTFDGQSQSGSDKQECKPKDKEEQLRAPVSIQHMKQKQTSVASYSQDSHDEAKDNEPMHFPISPRSSRDKVLKRLNGITDKSRSKDKYCADLETHSDTEIKHSALDAPQHEDPADGARNGPFSIMKFLWGEDEEDGEYENRGVARINPALLACGGPGTGKQLRDELQASIVHPYENKFTSLAASLMRRASKQGKRPSYGETGVTPDPRLLDWVDNQFAHRDKLPKDGSYMFGKSRTVIVHEIVRGNCK